MGVSNNRGTPKWMVKIMENPMNKLMIWGVPLFLETPKCAMVKVVAILGMGDLQPLMTGILIKGYINPYGIGFMSLSPIIWK